MSDVIGVRVPKRLKQGIEDLNLDYAEEFRSCLERAVKKKKLEQVMKEIDMFRNNLSKKAGETASSADIIREDRDHAH